MFLGVDYAEWVEQGTNILDVIAHLKLLYSNQKYATEDMTNTLDSIDHDKTGTGGVGGSGRETIRTIGIGRLLVSRSS